MPLILGGACKCPVCGGASFQEHVQPHPDARIKCLGCGFVSTIEEAVAGIVVAGHPVGPDPPDSLGRVRRDWPN
jgi:hypothetical protein